MREKGGLEVMKKAIEKLGKSHVEDLEVFGEDNDLRLCGKFETSSLKEFTFGVGDRGASVRIPKIVAARGFGYFED